MPIFPRSLLLASILVFVGCDSNGLVIESDVEPLLPLTVGHEWILSKTHEYVFETPRQEPDVADTFRVVRDTLIDGETWYEIREAAWERGKYTNYTDPEGLYTNRADGVWKRGTGDDAQAWLAFTYPTTEGDTYEAPCGIDGTATMRVVDTETIVTLPGQPSRPGIRYERMIPEGTVLARSDEFDSVLGETITEEFVLVPGLGFAVHELTYVSFRETGDRLTTHHRVRMTLQAADLK